MLKIGHFSKLACVPAKTLRYYDDIGLLKPALVDRESGYRYYSIDQLPRLNRIMALKDLGFSLNQITSLLDESLSAEQIQGMLMLKQAEIEEHMQAERERLDRVKRRLHEIRQEGAAFPYDIVLKPVPDQPVASIRKCVPSYAHIGSVIGQLYGMLGAAGADFSGPPLCIYHDTEYVENDADVEVAMPLAGHEGVREPLYQYILPGTSTMATTIHTGPYETITLAYIAAGNWLQANGYELAAPNREIYLRGPGKSTDPSMYVTELHFPVQKANQKG